MINIDKGKLGIILIVFAIIIFIIAICINAFPKKETEEQKIDKQLNDEQLQFLIKEMTKYLTSSENINESTSFSEDEMISFAFSYMSFLDKNSSYTKIDEENSIGIVSIKDIAECITYIFGVEDLDLEKVTYEIKDNILYIPLNLQGGDAQIYKYKDTTYNTTTDEYIVYIDCLEVMSANDVSSLITKSDYNEEDVLSTLIIKYKVVNDRKILLSYVIESKFEY